ncbi:thioredoxin reductase [Deinococcus metalli]|uniref:Pyridine nucleotide-disulfide oxidoreductase n=1 Tax=Deinococcus metalli TaxID=1141878 RepID=A0A7W8KBM7_9DEIO|nr:NAD(P)/FAD-dependent oxidoreductase [Deinococcus metalli]MBB5375204.1 thioredoxin reductase [Deinococcus metalli]GHF30990.1 pyridine nucleotide-disulfide oxidoreductase [Deinococcus metalli]
MTPAVDVVVIGAGPAGLSAALTLGRSRRRVLLLDGGPPRNAPVGAAHGLLTRDGIRPDDLKARALADLAPYDVTVRHEPAREVALTPDGFRVRVGLAWVEARRLLFTTGVRDLLPNVAGMRERWGRGVYHCPYCDGWEHHDAALGVYGTGQTGHHLALTVRAWSDRVTLLCDGPSQLTPVQKSDLTRLDVTVREQPIRALTGPSGGPVCVTFHGAPPVALDAVFLSPEQEPGSPLAHALGCAVNDRGRVIVDELGQTSVPGVWAAGDMTGAPQYVVSAAAAGMQAATCINTSLIHEDVRAQGANFHKGHAAE